MLNKLSNSRLIFECRELILQKQPYIMLNICYSCKVEIVDSIFWKILAKLINSIRNRFNADATVV